MTHTLTESERDIVATHYHLAAATVARFVRSLSFDTPIREGLHDAAVDGIIDGARGYTPDRGASLRTFIIHCARMRCLKFLRSLRAVKRGRDVKRRRMPHGIMSRYGIADTALECRDALEAFAALPLTGTRAAVRRELFAAGGEITNAEIGRRIGKSVARVKQIREEFREGVR